MKVGKKNLYSDKALMAEALASIITNLKPYPFPYITGYVSSLGGESRPSILLTTALQAKEQWPHGILENSKYAKWHIGHDGVMELISGHKVAKFRKATVKNTHDVITKLYAWAEKSQ